MSVGKFQIEERTRRGRLVQIVASNLTEDDSDDVLTDCVLRWEALGGRGIHPFERVELTEVKPNA